MKKFSPLLAMAVALTGAASAQAANYSTGFEGTTPLAGWAVTSGTVDNGPVVNTNLAFVHSGTQSLYLDWHDSAGFQFSPTDQFGTLTIWAYDLGKTLIAGPNTGGADGARWGAMNSAGDGFTAQIADRTSNVNAAGYSYSASDGGRDTGYYSNWGDGTRLTNAWNKFVFNRPDANTLTLTTNGGAPIVVPNDTNHDSASWLSGAGFSSIIFSGGGHYSDPLDPQLSGVYIDDVSFVAVPEPASLALLGLGAGTLLLGRRRRA